MSTVVDPKTGNNAAVLPCRSCQASVYWSTTDNGKVCPFNVVDNQPTRESHFRTCTEPSRWSKK